MRKLPKLFNSEISLNENIITAVSKRKDIEINQDQTKNAFSEKWTSANEKDLTNDKNFIHDQKKWFLSLYGFSNEDQLAEFLKGKIILDAGCGIGYKTSWVASLASDSIVVGMDISDSLDIAAQKYKNQENLFFIKGDIANTEFDCGVFDLVICDQVIMHTEKPEITFNHLGSLIKPSGYFFYYLYAKKALPRELVDDFFRHETHKITNKELWEFSSQLTELGKNLSELKVKINSPEIPLLNIKKGEYDLQRFIYWNFLKCFYNSEWDSSANDIVNFDWYSPSNAKRYTESEFNDLVLSNKFEINFFHKEEACFSGRLIKQD